MLDEPGGGGGGASGGEQVVADDDALAGFYSVFVNFERVRAVLQRVGNAGRLSGEFLRLANGNKAGAEPVRQSRSENEAARLDACNDINCMTLVVLAEPVNQQVEPLLVLQQRGQVVKKNARFRIVRHFADQFLQIVHSNVPSRIASFRFAYFNRCDR